MRVALCKQSAAEAHRELCLESNEADDQDTEPEKSSSQGEPMRGSPWKVTTYFKVIMKSMADQNLVPDVLSDIALH